MNKQVAIAGLIGAISAQDPIPCDGPFVEVAQAALDALNDEAETLAAATEALVAAAADEQTLFDTAEGRANDQTALMAPFILALTTATTNYTIDSDAVAAATTALTALTDPVADATAAKVAAQGLVDDQQADIDAQQLIVDQLQQAVTDHTTEKASMQVLLTTATGEYDAAVTAKGDAETAKGDLETTRDTDPGGQAALQVLTAADLVTKGNDYDTAVGEETVSFGTYRPAKLAYDKAAKECTMIDLGCTFAESGPVNYNCVGQANDPILALKTACDAARDGSISSTKDSETVTWEAAVTKVATKWSLKTSSNADDVVAQANLATINASIAVHTANLVATDPYGSLIVTLNTKTAAKDTAQLNFDTVDGQLTQATTDLGRGNVVLGALTAARTPLDEDLTVQKYLEGVQLDLQTVQEEAKATANANLTDLNDLVVLAQATKDRAQTTMDFYAGLLATATTNKTDADDMVDDNAAAIVLNTAAIAAAETALAAAVSDCKGWGYDEAQATLKDLLDAEDQRRADAADVKTAYEAKAAFNTTGETNTLCAFPPRAKDAAQEPRPECAEGFCCGAAQKFLKDGTKLAIETCQAETGVHTYTFYPPLPEGATVEPTPETWRFQCISGAQKLVAAATAALAASYMMA